MLTREAGARGRRRAKRVDHLVGPLRAGVARWKAAAVEAGLGVAMWSIALGHEVDRDDVGVAEVGTHQRDPLGQQVADALRSP